MNGTCSKCGMRMESPWSFCPQCGTASTHESQEAAVPEQHEQPPVKGAFSGLFLGVIVAPVLIIVGAMLCLTGLGAFVGVPMIIVGALSPLLGPNQRGPRKMPLVRRQSEQRGPHRRFRLPRVQRKNYRQESSGDRQGQLRIKAGDPRSGGIPGSLCRPLYAGGSATVALA